MSHPAEGKKIGHYLPEEAPVLDLRDEHCPGWFLGLRGMADGHHPTQGDLGR